MDSRKKNEKKRKERRDAKATLLRDRESRIRKLILALGIRDVVKGTALEKSLLSSHSPPVRIDFASDVPDGSEKASLTERLKAACGSARFDCPILGPDFPASEFFEFVAPMMDWVHNSRSSDSTFQNAQSAAQAKTREVESDDTYFRAIEAIHKLLEDVLIECSRINVAMYYVSVRLGKNAGGKRFVVFTVHRQLAEEIDVVLDGDKRPTFRCGQSNGLAGVQWCHWNPSVIGRMNEPLDYPVYVQSHVFSHLVERLNGTQLDFPEWLLHEWIWQSIQLATIDASKAGVIPSKFRLNHFLVNYFLLGHRVGYLCVKLHEGKIIVRTFLFLTMNETPEGSELQKRHALERSDKTYLELDRLETFVLSDICADPVLSELLEQCGCGGLLRMLKQPLETCLIRKRATEVKQYLKLDAEW